MLPIRTVELLGWGLDDYEFRPPVADPAKPLEAYEDVTGRDQYRQDDPLCTEATERLRDAMEQQRMRADLHEEMSGMDWSLGVVDLRVLLAFQRRLSFRPEWIVPTIPAQDDWPGLMSLAFDSSNSTQCEMHYDRAAQVLTMHSANPNFHLRVTGDPASPLTLHGGGPFFEAALYRGRWFLRDGYHRAALLLTAGVFLVPAVLVRAHSLEELGAAQPWFFPESVLFSDRPPRVVDFLDPALTIEYTRPATIKTLRVTMEETLSVAHGERTSGEHI